MKQRKLEDNEKASQLEKIVLLCSEITFMATNIYCLRKDIANIGPSEMSERVEEMRAVLQENIDKLFAVREDLADYKNNIDAVGDLDIAFGEVVYNAVKDLANESI